MNRRGFLGALAGVALATVAARTGFAQSKMPALIGVDEAMESDFSVSALRYTDKNAWYIVTRWDDEPPQMYLVTDQQIEELPAAEALRFRAKFRATEMAASWRAFYGANS